MKRARQAVLIMLIAVIPAGVAAFVHPRRPEWSREALAPGEERLKTVLEWGSAVLWVDARSQRDYETEHIPGALSLNLEEWDTLFPRFLDQWSPERKVVVYCSSLSCALSHEVADRLTQSGVSPVYVLKGGWEGWKANK
ncbi:MAG: rhodanese [Acidobacteria bacterium]|nr:MAG: rhodanese [Acidobacteriota bacterium]